MVGQHEDGRVEWRIRSPPAAPFLVGADGGPWTAVWRAKLASTHDFGADVNSMTTGEDVVNTGAATGLANHRMPKAGGEHPLVETLAGMPEWRIERGSLAGAEPVEGDREVMHVDP
jgi:hypothetical protein